MLTTREVKGVRVCRPARAGRELTKDGLPRHGRRIGKVFKTVFSPDGLKVVGFIVRQPDFLWMFKRPERFLSLDAFDVQNGFVIPTKGAASWDEKAIKRLGLDFDTCILWEGIEVKTSDGRELGFVDDISFDEHTGELNSLFLDDGIASRALVGMVEIPADLMVGYKKGVLIVEPQAAELLPQGGVAAKAGEATAKASQNVRDVQEKASDAAAEGIEAGQRGIGKLITRTKNMVTDTVDSYREESGANDEPDDGEPAPKPKPAAKKKASSAAKASSTKKKQVVDDDDDDDDDVKSVGEAVGAHMKAAGSMFGDFAREFNKARK
jgi:uncharacterized protein YrrD